MESKHGVVGGGEGLVGLPSAVPVAGGVVDSHIPVVVAEAVPLSATPVPVGGKSEGDEELRNMIDDVAQRTGTDPADILEAAGLIAARMQQRATPRAPGGIAQV